MSSIFSVGLMLSQVGATLLQGRLQKLAVLLLGTALQGVAFLLCGVAPVFSLFCAACALLGFFGGLVDIYANSVLTDVHKENSTRYLGYLHGLFGVGSLLAPLLMLGGLRMTSWRGVFWLLAAMLLLGTLALYRFFGRTKEGEAVEAPQENVLRLSDLKEYLSKPRNFALLAAGIFSTATQTCVLVWVLRYMTLRFDAEALGTTAISLFWICATLNRFSVAHLKARPLRLFIIGGALSAVCLTAGVLGGSALSMCVAMSGLGLCCGHFMLVIFRECARGYEGKTTFVTSIITLVMGITRVLVPLAMAYVTAALSVETSMLIPVAMALGVALCGLLIERLDARAGRRAAMIPPSQGV
jgi:MFS family permease